MAEATPQSAKRVEALRASDTANPKGADAAAPPLGAEAANDPEWALKFLARVSSRAAEKKLLNKSLPNWIYSQQNIDYMTGAVSAPDNPERDAVLKEVISELVHTGKLSATAAQTIGDRWRLYHDCATLGNMIIEGAAADRLLTVTLKDARNKILRLLNDAASLWVPLHQAAGLVIEEFKNTSATVRDPDLDAVFNPKNLRSRDGAPADRVTRIRYIQAIRALVREVRRPLPVENPVDPIQQGRGLTPVPLSRAIEPPPSLAVQDRLLSHGPALAFFGRVAMHPDITRFVTALNTGASAGRDVFIVMVADAIAANGKLADSIKSDTRRIWRFFAALRTGIATINGGPEATVTGSTPQPKPDPSPTRGVRFALTAAEIDALTQYALAIAPQMKTPIEEALDGLGILVTMLELFGGPLAPIGLIADALIKSAGAVVAFQQQIDQDRAESSTIFEKESDRLSTGGRYLEPVAQGVGALLAAAAVPGAVKELAGVRALHPPPRIRSGSAAEKGVESAHVPKAVTRGSPHLAPVESERAIGSPGVAKPNKVELPESASAMGSPSSKPQLEPNVEDPKPSTPPKEPSDLKLAKSEGPDIAKPTKQEVEGARQALKQQLDAMVAQGIIDRPQFDDLVMSVPQEDTFARLNGALLSSTGKRAVPEGLSAERAAARQLAENRALDLRQRLAAHWDAARPGKGKNKETVEEAAFKLYQELTKEAPPKGTLNREVRKRLYDNWRGRFIAAAADDNDLIRDLKEWAGITFTSPGSKVTAFRVQAVDAKGNLFWVDLNFDHAFRHEEAVERAFRTGDSTWLCPTVNSENLAPNLARENQTVKEGVHRLNESGWSVAPGPTPRAIQPFP